MTITADIAIIGRGFAGLSAALVCADAGFQVVIIGSRAKPRGGLQLGPNSFTSLSELPFGATVLSQTQPLDSIIISQLGSERRLAELPHPEQRFYASMSRATLNDILETLCSDHAYISMISSSVKTGIFGKGRPAAQIVTDDGLLVSATYVIGADGQNGFSRQLFSPQHSPEADYVAMRAECHSDSLPALFSQPHTRLMLGSGCHFVCYPFTQSQQVNLVYCMDKRQLTTGWQEQAFSGSALLAPLKSDAISWHSTPLSPAMHMPVWQHQRLTLIGDAAHSMPPHLAQGAGQSFDDVACLKQALEAELSLNSGGAGGRLPALGSALSKMATLRARMTGPVTRKAGITGALMRAGHLPGKVRNLLLDAGGEMILNSWMDDVWSSSSDRHPSAANHRTRT